VTSVAELERTSGSRRPALARCIGDADPFLRGTWGRRPSIHEGEDRLGFADLLTLDDVDRILSTTSLRTPAFRLVLAGEQIPETAYTRSGTTGSRPVAGMADPARVFELFRDGATIVFQGLHRYHEPVTRFCRELEVELGHPCQVNAYVTPAGAQGLELHDDPHDVFVLQAFGRKSWEIHTAPGEDEREPLRAEIGPGDCIYMPTRTPHAASTQRSLSGHLTVGVHVVAWRELVRAALDRIAADPSLDEPIPPGWPADLEGLERSLRERLEAAGDALEALDGRDIVDARFERFLSTRPPLIRGALLDQGTLDGIADGSRLARRDGSICVLRIRGDRLVALLGDRRLEMPAWLEPAMRRVAATPSFVVADLADVLPDPGARAVLARRLVREGLLRPLP
jgi:bifunctional lysine-specific demethylase and histidyl-hydroxylase NO66